MEDRSKPLEQAVEQSEYSDDWIESAWGNEGNQALLTDGPIELRPRVQRAIELCELNTGLNLLDIACGRGEVPAVACQMGVNAVGIDYSDASLKFATKVKSVHENQSSGRMNLVQADACELPFQSDSFDRITMLDIVEHLYPDQLEKMFGEVHRLLSPNGYAVVHTLPNRWVYDITYPLLHRVYKKVPADPRNPYEKKIHINEQDPVKLSRMLKNIGIPHRIWLEQHIPAQARWNAGMDRYNDNRDNVYPLMAKWPGRTLELLSKTPLKLLLSNDIFAIIWKAKKPKLANIPMCLSEQALISVL